MVVYARQGGYPGGICQAGRLPWWVYPGVYTLLYPGGYCTPWYMSQYTTLGTPTLLYLAGHMYVGAAAGGTVRGSGLKTEIN